MNKEEEIIIKEEEVKKKVELTEAEKLKMELIGEDGILRFSVENLPIEPRAKTNKRMFFEAVLIGENPKYIRKKGVKFRKGLLKEIYKGFEGRQLLTWHNDRRYAIGKIVEAWIEKDEEGYDLIKVNCWTDDREAQTAIETGKIFELSMGILPKLELRTEEEEIYYEITDAEPAEGSLVNFPAFAKAQIDKYWLEGSQEKFEVPIKEDKKMKEELEKLKAEKEELQKKVRELELKRVVEKYSLTEEEREEILDLAEKYSLVGEDLEKLVAKMSKNSEEKVKAEAKKLPISTKKEEKELEGSEEWKKKKAIELAEEFIKRKYNY